MVKSHSPISLIENLQCWECKKVVTDKVLHSVCSFCNSSLFVNYKIFPGINDHFQYENLPGMWKYFGVLPLRDRDNIVSLGEGLTPVFNFTNLKYKDYKSVFWKDEAGNPTGSFKARGISAAISKAKELGVTKVSIPSAGNAGGALAAYAAKANMKAQIFMPEDTPKIFKDECLLYGAELTLVKGSIADCGKVCNEVSAQQDYFQISTLKEPYRLEGKKTMGYEITEYFRYNLPDIIFYPTGGGTGLIGIWKAFDELEQMGWISSERPRMVAVQSESCNGISTAFLKGDTDSLFIDSGFTIANGLRVPKPFASKIILDVLRESKGTAIALNDTEIELAMKEIAKKEGLLPAPEGAALWAGYKKICDSGWVKPEDKVLLLNTGTGYKYLENINI